MVIYNFIKDISLEKEIVESLFSLVFKDSQKSRFDACVEVNVEPQAFDRILLFFFCLDPVEES